MSLLEDAERRMRVLARPPDDVARARMLAAVMTGLAAPTMVPERASILRFGLALALAVAVAIVAIRVRPHDPEVVVVPRPMPIVPVPVPAPVAPVDHFLLPSGPSDAIDAPAGAVVRADWGERGRVELAGPARLEVAGAGALRLGGGGVLWLTNRGLPVRVTTDDAEATLRGARFAVDARGGGTRFAVLDGAGEVRAGGELRQLLAGTSWRVGDRALEAVPHDLLAPRPAPPPPPAPVRIRTRPTRPSPTPTEPTIEELLGPTPPLKPVPPAPAPMVTPRAPDPEPLPKPPAAPPRTQAPPPPRDQAEVLYDWAGEAFATGKTDEGNRILAQIAEYFPDHAMAARAHLDLAAAAERRGDLAGARRHVDQVLARPFGEATAEAAQWLRCRLDVRDQPAGADDCLWGFRLRFPSSPHDAEALALRAGLAQARGCAAEQPLLDEYLKRYPQGAFAEEAGERKRACP